ncbi:MAG: hypothetical protein CVU11_01495 [Bacteroidetes bacterium HGW-Bacteroidetes-6]|jgi:hypothetical protein|nr:MAG: hypothetical protein CVU11_01495 [Bacteroidetes bacterium HGW-Bacteroidetes-6]
MKKRKKSVLFIALCVMSAMGGTFGVLLGVLSIIDLDLITFAARVPGYTSIKSLTYDASTLYPYAKIVFYGLSLAGAIIMFQLQKRGFYFYASAQLALLIIPYLMWNQPAALVFFTDLPDMIFTFAFIGAYAIYLPAMRQVSLPEASGTEK